MDGFFGFTREFVPKVLRHTGAWAVAVMAIGLANFVQRDAIGLAWAAFLIAASAVLGRASDAAMRELREEREREVEALPAEDRERIERAKAKRERKAAARRGEP